ncbi:hypothetical protein Tco_1224447 [Tanacetum coccineum]
MRNETTISKGHSHGCGFPRRQGSSGTGVSESAKPAKERRHISTGIPASDTQEYPSLIDTFWRTHTVDGVFPKDEDRRIYEEMKRLEATGEYTEDEINALARGGKLRGHIPGVGRVLPSRVTSRPKATTSTRICLRNKFLKLSPPRSPSPGCGDDEESGDDKDDDGER